MKNLFLTILLFVLAFTLNINVTAKVLPVSEEAESLDKLIFQDSDNPDIPDTLILSVRIVKADGLSASNCFGKENIDIKKNRYGVFQPFSSVTNLVVRTEVFQLSEEYKIIGKNFPARFHRRIWRGR